MFNMFKVIYSIKATDYSCLSYETFTAPLTVTLNNYNSVATVTQMFSF